jgi:hypothetical protein
MLVISAKSGQLGNRLLIFANAIAFASEYNLRILNPSFEDYAEFFEATSQDVLCSYPAPRFKLSSNSFLRKHYYAINRRLVNSHFFKTASITRQQPFNWSKSVISNQIISQPITFLQGWLYREGWFIEDLQLLHKYRDSIRKYFTPQAKYQAAVSALVGRAKQSCDLLVGLHIRQGDYAEFKNGKFFFTTEEYTKLMKSVTDLFPTQTVGFLICSNAPQENKYFAGFNYLFGSNHIIEDMYALAECDYIIGPPSTYTMWASFYGQKPLYMIRDLHKELTLNHFVYSDQWQGTFYPHEDWNKATWEWTH